VDLFSTLLLNAFKIGRTLTPAKLNTFKKGVDVDIKVWMYLAYLTISIGLTVWVARTLSHNGLVFLEEVFADSRLAKAVNRLLVVGFYLLNLGYDSVAMKYGGAVDSASRAMEELSLKIGLVLLVLGALHFFNVFALGRYRRGRLRQMEVRPPVAPVTRLMAPAMAGPGPVPPGSQMTQPAPSRTQPPWDGHPTRPVPPAPPVQPGPPPAAPQPPADPPRDER
jgi:hypothetical protein